MASKTVIEKYKKARDAYQRKIRRMERNNPDYNWREVLGWPAKLNDVKKLTTNEVNVLIRDMQGFTDKYGHVMEDRNGVRAPRAYWEQYDRAIRRENVRREKARKNAMTKYEVQNNLKPPTNKVGERFAKFISHVLDIADPLYRRRMNKQMQDTYISKLQDALNMYGLMQERRPNDQTIKTLVQNLKGLIRYLKGLTPQEFYRKYVNDAENRIDFEQIYVEESWTIEDVIQEFQEIEYTWRRL